MSGVLPFPISFELPDGWRLADPETVGEKDAAYVALREANLVDVFVTNIAVSGLGVREAVDPGALAADHATALQAQHKATVLRRNVLAKGPVSEVAQLLKIEYTTGESSTTLNQVQIITAYEDRTQPNAFGLVQLVLTCPDNVLDRAGPEFARFIATIRPQATAAPSP